TPYYFVHQPSRHPAMAAAGLLIIIVSAAQWSNGTEWAMWTLLVGFLWLFTVLFQWFRDAIVESQSGIYGHKVDLSFRWSMSWFIVAELMFCGAFFTALCSSRQHS